MFQVLFYISAVFVGWWMGENLQLAPLLVIFVVGGFVVYGLLRNTEGLAAISWHAGWCVVCGLFRLYDGRLLSLNTADGHR
jgi:hypothetical protein